MGGPLFCHKCRGPQHTFEGRHQKTTDRVSSFLWASDHRGSLRHVPRATAAARKTSAAPTSGNARGAQQGSEGGGRLCAVSGSGRADWCTSLEPDCASWLQRGPGGVRRAGDSGGGNGRTLPAKSSRLRPQESRALRGVPPVGPRGGWAGARALLPYASCRGPRFGTKYIKQKLG